MHDEWLKKRMVYLCGSPSDYQRLLLLLGEILHPTTEEERKLAALVRAEKAADRGELLESPCFQCNSARWY
jgi:hypothetical protein